TAQRPAGPLAPCTSGNYSVSVIPDGTARSWPNWTSHVDTFTVTNTSTDCSDTYAMSYTATGPLYGVTLNKTTAFLNPLASTKVVATYSVGDPAAGVLKLKALGTNAGSGVSDTSWFNVTATQPPGSPRADLTPYNAENQDYSRCTASCFSATYALSTVPYF